MVNGRRKGNDYENEICRELSRWVRPSLPAKVLLADLPIRRRSTSIMPINGLWHGAGDLLHKPELDEVWPFCVECKKVEGWTVDGFFNPKWSVRNWWDQAVAQARACGRVPLLICSRKQAPDYAILRERDAQCLRLQSLQLVLSQPGREDLSLLLLDDVVKAKPKLLRRLVSTGRRSRT